MKQTLLILTACLATHASAWQIGDFVLSQARPAGIGAVQPAADGKYYYQISDNERNIDRIDYNSGTSVKPMLRTDELTGITVDSWDGYEVSGDEQRILLWTIISPATR